MPLNLYNPNTGVLLKPGETVISKETGQKITQGTEFVPFVAPTPAPITPVIKEPTKTSEIATGNIPAPTLTTPTAPAQTQNFADTMQIDLEAKKKAYETQLKKQIDDLQKKSKEAQAKIDTFTAQQQGVLSQVEPLTAPFRETLETTERQRLAVESNFAENQKATDEMAGLLTQIQQDLKTAKEVTGLESIRAPRVAQATEDATARVGVLEAVMAARNNQITVAENMIDRTVTAITADRTDKLNYFNTLLNFYSTQKDEEGKKLITLTASEKSYIDTQITDLKASVDSAQTNADYIKSLMINPETAKIVQDSGVTLNDTPEQVQAKFATYAYTKEVTDDSNAMSKQGYQYLLPEQVSKYPQNEIFTLTDTRGNITNWRRPIEKAPGVGGVPTTPEGKIILNPDDAQKINKEMITTDPYKAITKGQDSLQFLKSFEDLFNETGATSAVWSPMKNKELKVKYNTTILNLKEFFNLGVISGPDEALLKSVLPDPTNISAFNLVATKATRAGIDNMKEMINQSLDTRYETLKTQYGNYSEENVTALKDLDRIYIEQKIKLDPKIAQMVIENPNMTKEEILQIIGK